MFKLFKILLLGGLLSFLNFSLDIQEGKEVKHIVEVKHFGISLTESVERTLFEIKNDQGHSKEFYMNVETVVCGDTQCRIDTVRVYWNAFGFYDRLVLPSGVELEKAEGEHFNQEDYKKLNSILANKNSSLKDVYKEEVVGSETSEGIDAMTGATIILNNKDYVKGAVWTCYTLWHWVNGDVFSIIRNITGGNLSSNQLIGFFKKENPMQQFFALEQFIQQQIYEPKVMDVILEKAPSNDYQLTKLTIEYFESATSGIYFKTIKEFLKDGNTDQRILYLTSLLNNKNPPPKGFYESLSLQLSTWNDYPTINLFFRILERKKVSSPEIIQEIIPLLDQEDFIIARRIFWFLQEKRLSQKQQIKLNEFQLKFEDRL